MSTPLHEIPVKRAAGRTPSACALKDLSALPRLGARGRSAATSLAAAGFSLPKAPNQSTRASSGEILLRLSGDEYLLLGSPEDGGARARALETAMSAAGENDLYLLPRQDSHAWFCLSGTRRHEVMAKLCGVDLSPEAFPFHAIAQTSVARINVIVAGDGTAETGEDGVFHLLFDRAFASYFQEVLVDAMAEFDEAAA
jgi:sarcosine oxidase subunit gamma